MPKYEYACKSCGERIEVKQSFEDDPLTECPACGGRLRKVFSSPAIVLRGPGFYRTDHRSPYRPDGILPGSKEKDRDPAESKGSSDSQSGDSKSGDSQPGDSKGGDSKGSDSGGDSKGSDSKGSDSKGSDARSSESKGSDTGGSRDSGGSRESRDSRGSGSGGSSGDTGGAKDAARTA